MKTKIENKNTNVIKLKLKLKYIKIYLLYVPFLLVVLPSMEQLAYYNYFFSQLLLDLLFNEFKNIVFWIQ